MKKSIIAVMMSLSLSACVVNPDGSKLKCGDESSALEYYNRAMFNFNYQFNKKILRPVAKGYKSVTNQFVRDRVSMFFNNLEEPANTVNNVLQGQIKATGISVSRFVINSTLGLAGTFDVAKGWGLEQKKNTFDGTLAKYCVPDGPFFVMPILGPATPRYIVGWGADSLASPMYWALLDVDDKNVEYAGYGAIGLKYINYYAENMQILDGLEESSVDFYATLKSAFLQNRKKLENLCAQVENGQTASDYDFDFGYDDVDDMDFNDE